MDKTKASKVFTKLANANPMLAGAGLKYAKKLQANGIAHIITDIGLPVKALAAILDSLESAISNGTLFYDGVPKWTRHKEKKENFFFATNQ
jgi:hypothetical protein